MFEMKRTAANAEEFERVLFVCKARSNDRNHPFASVVHVEWSKAGSRIIASDGQRLHVTEIKRRIDRGNYQPVITKDTISLGKPVEGIVFPPWRNAVPEHPIKKGNIDLEQAKLSRNAELAAGLSVAFSLLVKKTGEVVNLRYLDDLPKGKWAVSVHKDKKTVILLEQQGAAGETYAVLLPVMKAA
jgi:hypothetical protein